MCCIILATLLLPVSSSFLSIMELATLRDYLGCRTTFTAAQACKLSTFIDAVWSQVHPLLQGQDGQLLLLALGLQPWLSLERSPVTQMLLQVIAIAAACPAYLCLFASSHSLVPSF